MLSMRPNCECCDVDLPATSTEAWICSFECTFCQTCATETLGRQCPNCGGGLVSRPIRPEALLLKYPPQSERVVRPEPCHP